MKRLHSCLLVCGALAGGMACGSSSPETPVSRQPQAASITDRKELGSRNGACIQLPLWKWRDITANLSRIRDAGFTAILISPHQSTCGGPFSAGYDPWDYTNFNSGFGSESELRWLIGSAHGHGLQVYADMVLNPFLST